MKVRSSTVFSNFENARHSVLDFSLQLIFLSKTTELDTLKILSLEISTMKPLIGSNQVDSDSYFPTEKLTMVFYG